MEIDIEVFINAVCARPALWDKTDDCYKVRDETGKSWREVCEILNAEFKSLSIL